MFIENLQQWVPSFACITEYHISCFCYRKETLVTINISIFILYVQILAFSFVVHIPEKWTCIEQKIIFADSGANAYDCAPIRL